MHLSYKSQYLIKNQKIATMTSIKIHYNVLLPNWHTSQAFGITFSILNLGRSPTRSGSPST